MTFNTGKGSGSSRCPICHETIEKDISTIVANLGSGKFQRVYHQSCFLDKYPKALNELTNVEWFKDAYGIIHDYGWKHIPEDERVEIEEKLQGLTWY